MPCSSRPNLHQPQRLRAAPDTSVAPATMGMRLTLIMASSKEIDAVSGDEAALLNLIEEPELPNSLDLDKAWHGIHYLLTGTVDPTEGPLGSVILGGEEVGPDLGYGPARVLGPAQVSAAAAALQAISADQLRQKFDAKAMDDAAVYPNVWEREGPEALNWLQAGFEELRGFYERAAKQGKSVIIALL